MYMYDHVKDKYSKLTVCKYRQSKQIWSTNNNIKTMLKTYNYYTVQHARGPIP